MNCKTMAVAFLLAGTAPALPSSMVDDSASDLGYGNCAGHSLFSRRLGGTVTVGDQSIGLHARAHVSIRNPGGAAGYRTVVTLGFTATDFVPSINRLFQLMEVHGCDRLHYLNDAAAVRTDTGWTVSGTFRHVERICSSIGSTTIGSVSRPVRIHIEPHMRLVPDGTDARLEASISAEYEVPVFLTFSLRDQLFDPVVTSHQLPDIAAANLEQSTFSHSVEGGSLTAETTVTMRSLPHSLACRAKQAIGEALWQTGKWGRAH